MVSTWRPAPRIRPISIGVACRGGEILVVHVLDDSGTLKGCRPPGGGIEFRESAEAALHREFREEFGCAVAVLGPPVVLENLYDHHGAPGHEIVFAHPIRLLDPALHRRDRFTIAEDNGITVTAEWLAAERFRTGEITLFPPGLLRHLGDLMAGTGEKS